MKTFIPPRGNAEWQKLGTKDRSFGKPIRLRLTPLDVYAQQSGDIEAGGVPGTRRRPLTKRT